MKNLIFIPELPKENETFNIVIKYASSYLKKGFKKIEIQKIKKYKNGFESIKILDTVDGVFPKFKDCKNFINSKEGKELLNKYK